MDRSVVAIGNFDGLHFGHDKIIREAINLAEKHGYSVKLITFEYDFNSLKNKSKKYKKIYGHEGKKNSFEKYDLDDVIYINLNEEISSMLPEYFVENILIEKFNVAGIVVGENFRFGVNASGNTHTLLKIGEEKKILIKIVDSVFKNGILVSSTIIREYISAGRMEEANSLLTDNYTLYIMDYIYEKKDSQLLMEKDGYVFPPDGKYTYLNSKGENDILGISHINGTVIINLPEVLYDEKIVFL